MATRLEVIASNAVDFSGSGVLSRQPVHVYYLPEDLSEEDIEKVRAALVDPVTEKLFVNRPALVIPRKKRKKYSVMEVTPKPGVTDPWGNETRRFLERVLQRSLIRFVYARQYVIEGRKKDAELYRQQLGNAVVNDFSVFDSSQLWRAARQEYPAARIPRIKPFTYVNLNVSDEKLMEISRKRELALNLAEMKATQAQFNDPEYQELLKKKGLRPLPTDAALESNAQTWSEHCVHKKFRGSWEYTSDDPNDESGLPSVVNNMFKTYIQLPSERIAKKKDWIVSLFKDNAGVIRLTWSKFAKRIFNVSHKVETHNHPSQLDPFGGADTGSGGVFRDPHGTGIGMKIVSSQYGFRVPFLNHYRELSMSDVFLAPWKILEGIVAGVEDYGNKMGIPTRLGSVMFGNGWLKPGVIVGAVGVAPAKIRNRQTHVKKIEDGYIAISLGGAVGKDGIHGATASSKDLETKVTASLNQSVQIGYPIVEKGVFDVGLMLRDMGWVEAMQDCGAGGWNSAVGELGEISNGVTMDLSHVPEKYKGLMSWEKLISESQERMVIVIRPENYKKVMDFCRHYEVSATKIARFNNSGYYEVKDRGKTVVYLPMDFLHKGLPQMTIKAHHKPWKGEEPVLRPVRDNDYTNRLHRLIGSPNLQCFHDITTRYDHTVQGGTLVSQIVGRGRGLSDAVAYQPILDQKEILIESVGDNPWQGVIDSYHMGRNNVIDALGKIIALGGDLRRVAFNDNTLCPKPETDPEIAAKVLRMIKGAADACEHFGTPMISGKDSTSMQRDYPDPKTGDKRTAKAMPELMMSALGVMPDKKTIVTSDFKLGGDLIYVVGRTKNELGSSAYYDMLHEVGANVPRTDREFDEVSKNFKGMIASTRKHLLNSAQYISRGGLAKALANSAIGGDVGFHMDIYDVRQGITDEQMLFSESVGRFVVSVDARNKQAFEQVMKKYEVFYSKVGVVQDGKQAGKRTDQNTDVKNVTITSGLDTIISSDVEQLRKAWQGRIDVNNLREYAA